MKLTVQVFLALFLTMAVISGGAAMISHVAPVHAFLPVTSSPA